MTRIWSRIEPGAVAGVSARITLGRKLKQLRVVVFARAMILMIFTVCTLLPGSHASAQENDDAEALNAEVERLYEAGRYDEAIPLAVRALAISEKVLGPEHPQVALSLNNLARLYWAKGDYVRAGPLFERALATREKVLGPEHPGVATTLNNLGELYLAKGDYVRAEPLFERALAIREKVLGPDHPDVARSLNSLARLYWAKGDYTRAEPLYERALAIREKVLGPEHPDVAITLGNLGELHWDTGDYARAEPLFERAIAIQEKVLRPEHPDVAYSLDSLAGLYRDKGDYVRAEPLFERALAIREKALGPEHPDVAYSLDSLAGLYHDKGDYVRAEPLFERALAIQEKVLGPEHPQVGVTLNNLAYLYRDKGDYARAEPLFKRDLAISEKALGPEHPDISVTLNNLAVLYWLRGDYARAEPLCERALAISEKAYGSDHPRVGTSLNNLGLLYRDKGDYARAEPLLKRSLAISEKALGPEHPDISVTLNNLGKLYLAKGDYVRAGPLFERALAIREKVLGPEHPLVGVSLNYLSELYWAKGDYTQVETLRRRALEIEERTISLLLPTGSEHQARAFMRTLSGSTSIILSFQRARTGVPSTTRLALTTVLRRKGRVLDALSTGLGALHLASQLLDSLLERRDALARLVIRGPGSASPEVHREAVEKLRREVDVLERKALRRGGALRLVTAPVEIEDVQSQIPAGTALIEMVEYYEFNPAPAPGGGRWGSKHLGAFVLGSQGEPQWIPLGEATGTIESVGAYRESLVNRTLSRARLRERAQDLYNRLVAPLEVHLHGVHALLLAPDGVLNLVSFGALEDSEGRYLVERFELNYLTTGRDLLRLGLEGVGSPSPPLVVAAPDFGKRLATVALQSYERSAKGSREIRELRFSPLPGTQSEALAIGKALGVTALTGAKATESAIRNQRAPRVLHIATHAFFLPDQVSEPLDQREILLGASNTNASVFGAPTPNTENPLLRSGLALAGANLPPTDLDDGILTALELAGLDLWGTQLVVLSACETGLGEVAVGEGVYGLRRALMIAGAESQLVSLWKVNDVVTEELMTAYYERLLAGDGRAAALRRVQLDLLQNRSRRHPYFWASFIPIGAWGPLALSDAPVDKNLQ